MPQKKKLSEKVDKRHRGRVRIGVDQHGKPIYKWISGDTKAELVQERKKIKDYYIGGELVERDQTFDAYATSWFKTYKKGTLSFASEEMYLGILNTYLIPTFTLRQMNAIRSKDVQNLLNANAHKSHSTVKKIALTASQIFRQAYAEGVVDRDPTVALRIPGKTGDARRALTGAEVTATLKVAAEHERGMLLMLLYYLGVRVGEALGLQWSDFDFDAKTVHIQRDIDLKTNKVGALKTAASERYIPLPNAIYDYLKEHEQAAGYVLRSASGEFIGHTVYNRIWLDLMRALYEADETIESRTAKKRYDKNRQPESEDDKSNEVRRSVLTAHYYRHNYATLLHAADVSVTQARDWLGHTDIQTTINIYTHLDKEKNAKKAAEAQDFFK